MKHIEFFVAFRFLKYKLLRSIIIILAISIGIAVQFFVAIIIDSTQANLIKRTLGNSPHITIKPYENDKLNSKIKNPDLIIQKLNLDLNKFKKIITVVNQNVLVSDFYNKNSISGNLVGFYDILDKDLYGIEENLIIGKNNLESNEAIIGYSIYEKLNLDLNKFISIKNNNQEYKGIKIVGVFKTGNQLIDSYILMKRENVQDFLGYKRNEYSSLFFQVNNVFESDKIKKEILNFYNEPYEITEWKESNRQLLNGLSAQSQSSFFIQFFILMSIGVSILSIINMKIMEKYKEIGVLKAIGMKNINIIKIFLYMSFILGLSSVILGTGLAFGILNLFINLTKNEQGIPLFNLVIKTNYLILSILFNIFVVVLAGYLSSKKVIKIEPAKIIIGG